MDQEDEQIGRGFLTGKLLIAMPFQEDPRFSQSVIYICGHDDTGAMGIMVNKPLLTVDFSDLLEQLGIEFSKKMVPNIPVFYGGPVEIGRGFVLHTLEYGSDSTVGISGNFALTATLDVLRALANNHGPAHTVVALGYVGWGAGQLEQEINSNGWLIIDATIDLVFQQDYQELWRSAMLSIGIEPNSIAIEFGHA
ncbi:YqgE/AlgH family protein [Candidatus Odyssella thessalonicensis]|uniref:YqgE/AlgH family protein n=1 Tax=Candidatus Odyssella thessalonicensis TaxID=84647 RepID=UPI000225B916|nr:YqgE/AlgH family protein [Candidatus Odyssella thessalonicensis]